MDQIMNYVKPELIVVAVALYFIGMALKQAQSVKDKYIPLLLGGVSIVLCAIWVHCDKRRSRMRRRRQWLSLPRSRRVFLSPD